MQKFKIYLAGPLFTMAERQFNTNLGQILRQVFGHEVWLPQEHEPRVENVSGKQLAEEIFKADIGGLDWADVVVACMDGPDPDSGTAFECGYAVRGLIPVVTFRTDFRQAGDAGDTPFNLMLSASSRGIVLHNSMLHPDIIDLAGAINKALAKI